MKIFLVSVPLEFPLASYCIAAQLSSVFDNNALQIEVLHLNVFKLRDYNSKNTEIWKYIAKIEAEKPDVIAFSVYLWNNLIVKELVSITSRLYPSIKLIVGGPEMATAASVLPWVSTGQIKAAVRGEGEFTMSEIVHRLINGDGLFGVAGCSWWTGTSVIHEQPRPAARDLSQFTSPYLSGWITESMFDRYHDTGGSVVKGAFPRAFLETYRGCYMQCSYCQWGNGTKSRSPFPLGRVQDEITWLLSKRIRTLWVVDAMFGFKKAQAKELLHHIISEKARAKVDTNIVCYHNQDFYDPELFELYREANVSVEVDLQSTNRDVLTGVGRAKWYTDSFDRHLDAFHSHKVPTTGAADLIIGLPHDNLQTFADSVNFLLVRGMHVNLYQTSIIPDTPMSRSIAEYGIVHSEIAPRAVFRNKSFPVDQMVRARLIGHGVDFFRRYPKTASLLWRQKFARPVEFCAHLGDILWERYDLMYGESHILDAVLSDKQDILRELLPELCANSRALPLIRDLFEFEAAASKLCFPPDGASWRILGRKEYCSLSTTDEWLDSKLIYNRPEIEEVDTQYDMTTLLKQIESQRDCDVLELIEARTETIPTTCLIYLTAPRHVDFVPVRSKLVMELLHRSTGYFSVRECLTNLTSDSGNKDLTPLWKRLAFLVGIGIVEVRHEKFSCGPIRDKSSASAIAHA